MGAEPAIATTARQSPLCVTGVRGCCVSSMWTRELPQTRTEQWPQEARCDVLIARVRRVRLCNRDRAEKRVGMG